MANVRTVIIVPVEGESIKSFAEAMASLVQADVEVTATFDGAKLRATEYDSVETILAQYEQVLEHRRVSPDDRIQKAANLIDKYGYIGGGSHKQWLVDQVLRALLLENYQKWVEAREADIRRDDPDYRWDVGVSP